MMHSRTTAEFIRHMARLPTRGEGYCILCVDRFGGGVVTSAQRKKAWKEVRLYAVTS